MARQIVFSSKAAKPPPTYSQAVKAAGLVFVSGTAPTDPNTGAITGATIQEQTAQCLHNMPLGPQKKCLDTRTFPSVGVILKDSATA